MGLVAGAVPASAQNVGAGRIYMWTSAARAAVGIVSSLMEAKYGRPLRGKIAGPQD